MFFHVLAVPASANIVVRISDTDCLLTGIGCQSTLHPTLMIWIEADFQKINTLRYVTIGQV